MRRMMMLNKKQLKIHLIAWGGILSYLNIIDPIPASSLLGRVICTALCHGNYISVFYSFALLILPLFWERKRILLVLAVVIALFAYWFNCYFIYFKIMPFYGVETGYKSETAYYFFKTTFYFFVICSSAGAASFFSRHGLYKLKLQGEKDKELLLKELNFIKNHFNSKITFDFLDYNYSEVLPHSKETAKSIKLFSNMLTYTFNTKPEEKVPLSKEIDYIENFINLQKLLSVKVFVNFTHKDHLEDKKILPRILITFVENAFKHGQFNEAEYPIEIQLEVINNQLIFSVMNKINPTKKMVSSHTGLENVTQILDLYYPNQYHLKKEELEGFYQVELSMTLN